MDFQMKKKTDGNQGNHMFPRWAGIACALTMALALSSCMGDDNKNSSAGGASGTTTTHSTAATTQAETTAGDPVATTLPPAAGEPSSYPAEGWINSDSVNIRKTPDLSLYPIGGTKTGEKFTVLGKEGDWYKIRFQGGEAYVNAQFISFTLVTAPATTEAPATTPGTTAETTVS